MKQIHILFAENDRTEGKGGMSPVAFFTNKHDAKTVKNDPRYYKEYGVMGTNSSSDYQIREGILYENAGEFFKAKEDKRREIALSKLNDEDKKVLGL